MKTVLSYLGLEMGVFSRFLYQQMLSCRVGILVLLRRHVGLPPGMVRTKIGDWACEAIERQKSVTKTLGGLVRKINLQHRELS